MAKINEITAWERVLLARHNKRPTAKDLIKAITTSFVELHGDRLYKDDSAIIGGIGFIEDIPFTIIAQEKGETTEAKIKANFGMMNPEGYRKALRLMKQAEKFKRPILTIIDTPGAYPGVGAEERGQGLAVAKNLMEMINIKVPIISVVLGEGGSGGALGIGVSDEIWMFENAVYSILSPEGFASILYKTTDNLEEVADSMKLTANDLLKYKIIEKIIPERKGGLHIDSSEAFALFKKDLVNKINELNQIDTEELLKKRYKKYRSIGIYEEV